MFVNFRILVTVIVELLARSRAWDMDQNMDQNMDQCRPTASPRLALRAEPQRSPRSLALRGREIWGKRQVIVKPNCKTIESCNGRAPSFLSQGLLINRYPSCSVHFFLRFLTLENYF